MPRTKETPTKKRPREEEEEQRVDLRVRHAGGVLAMTSQGGTLSALFERLQKELKAPLTTASFRDAQGKPVTLLSDGTYGVLGEDTKISTIFSQNDVLTVSMKATTAKSALGPTLTKAALEGPKTADSLESIAANFVNAHTGSDTLMGTASAMYVSRQGTDRIEACRKGLARIAKRTPSQYIHVAYKTSNRARSEKEDKVRLFSPEECNRLVLLVLNRQAGSMRRRQACDKPSTRLLQIESVASRCPALFWSLYAHSTQDDTTPGDVPYMLDHVLQNALEAFKQSQQQNS